MAQALQKATSSAYCLRGLSAPTCTKQQQSRSVVLVRPACANQSHHCFSAQALLPNLVVAEKSLTLGGKLRSKQWCEKSQKRGHSVRAAAQEGTRLEKESDGPPVQLGTAELPEDIDLAKLKALLYQWANSIVTSSALPLPLPLKVDSLDNGVRLAFIRIEGGEISELFNIDVLLTPKEEGERRPMFRVIRDGQYKNQKAAFEPQVMSSLLAALKKAVPLSRGA